jgi:hypothetical protein
MCRTFLSFASLSWLASSLARPRARFDGRFLALALAVLGTACAWEPKAKPVQPELLVAGAVKVDRLVDRVTQRFVLITRDPAGPAPRRAIVERANKTVCDLPEGTKQVDGALFDPKAAAGGPVFLLPVHVTREGEDRALYYADEHCELRGPFGRAQSTSPLTLDGTNQEVSLVNNGKGGLSLVNPWTSQVTPIAERVSRSIGVRRPSNGEAAIGPQLLWLLEGGALTQRSLTGELVFSRGTAVTAFEQALYDTLRVAYVDGGNLYEAAGPDFAPVRLADDACEPFYMGVSLNLYTPCKARQLVRIDLTTGEAETFEPGMLWTYEQSGFLFEYVRDQEGVQFYVTAPGRAERVRVFPSLIDMVQVVDAQRIVGRTEDGSFVLWDARVASNDDPKRGRVELLARAGQPVAYPDMRANEVFWVFPHNIEGGRGTLSLFSQSSFALETVGENVPTSEFSVEVLAQVSEAAIVLIEDAEPVSETDKRLRGRLRARLISGELGSVVDENVTTYVSVYTPLEGLVYSVEDGDRSGLWFAAL